MIARLYQGFNYSLTEYSVHIFALMHGVGVIGLLSPWSTFFQLLTPLNLLVSAYVLVINQEHQSLRFLYYAALVFILGFFVEVVGVQTGMIFGDYTYGQTLGIKLFGVPLLIGLNWLLVMYSVAVLTDKFNLPVLVKILLGATLAVFLDLFIEPVAVHFDFWRWTSVNVPLQNYIGWFFTASFFQALYHGFKLKIENKVAIPYLITNLIFFIILSVFISS